MASAEQAKGAIVAFPIASAELAWYLERQVELAAGISDVAVNAEVDRKLAAPRANLRRLALFEVAFLAFFTALAIFGVRACGVPLTSVAVHDAPRETRVTLKKAGVMFFSAELDFAEGGYRNRDDVPRSLRFSIDVLREHTVLHSMRCDPLDMFVWVSSSSSQNISALEGRLDACAVRLPQGSYTLRVARSWEPGLKPVRYSATEITARLE